MSEQNTKKENPYPVREGKEESSILHDEKKKGENTYPDAGTKKDDPEKNQPEFIAEQPNRPNKQ